MRRRQLHAAALVDALHRPQQVAKHRFAGVGDCRPLRPSIMASRMGGGASGPTLRRIDIAMRNAFQAPQKQIFHC
jgi:hypothetical protein